MDLLIVRHAESEPNVAGTINSDPKRPSSLTARGRAQAAELGGRLAAQQIDVCITSQLERSIATADIALAGRLIERRVMRELALASRQWARRAEPGRGREPAGCTASLCPRVLVARLNAGRASARRCPRDADRMAALGPRAGRDGWHR
ncbi:MAG: histidine phosphatase family protein [Actinobacteria bacterium]|nr:MAG: histidine phosphatase family protein [Actinomycetota bacterium]